MMPADTSLKAVSTVVREIILDDPRRARDSRGIIERLPGQYGKFDLETLVSSTLAEIRREWATATVIKLRPYHYAIARKMLYESHKKGQIVSTPAINSAIKKLMGRGVFMGTITNIVQTAKLDLGLLPSGKVTPSGALPEIPSTYKGARLQVYASTDPKEWEKRRDLVAQCLRLEEKIPAKTAKFFKIITGRNVNRMPPLSPPEQIIREIPLVEGSTTTDDLRALIKGTKRNAKVRVLGQE
jgi:hypothetical protein